MKKNLVMFFTLTCFLAFSCSKNKETDAVTQEKNDTVIQEESIPKIDYDLTGMNYNMLSAITFEMLIEPEKYADKTVKISGQFYTEVENDIRYYSVIIWDATLCCPAGMDFIPPSTMTFPDDFPAEENQITVTGILKENAQDGNLLFYAEKVEL